MLTHVTKSSGDQIISIQGLGPSQQASFHRIVQVSRFFSATVSLKCRPPIYRVRSICPSSEDPVTGSPLKPKLTPYFFLSSPFPGLQQNQLTDSSPRVHLPTTLTQQSLLHMPSLSVTQEDFPCFIAISAML